jgi:hypothetical protein
MTELAQISIDNGVKSVSGRPINGTFNTKSIYIDIKKTIVFGYLYVHSYIVIMNLDNMSILLRRHHPMGITKVILFDRPLNNEDLIDKGFYENIQFIDFANKINILNDMETLITECGNIIFDINQGLNIFHVNYNK